jgi:glycosyltransferase involved in cell wall biosynthesis
MGTDKIFLIEEISGKIKVTYLGVSEKNFIVETKSPNGEIKFQLKTFFSCYMHWRIFDFPHKGFSHLIISDEIDSSIHQIYKFSEESKVAEVKVSVIIPCYNFGKYIEHCIYSVLSQRTDFEYEILVGDDFSTDSTKSILDRLSLYNPNLKYFRYNKNIGGKNNVKFLLDNSVGKYISYLDGDDFWTDNLKLQKQIDFLDSNPEYSMCFTGHWVYGEDGISYPKNGWLGHVSNGGKIDSDYLLTSNSVSALTKVFRNYKDENWEEYLNKIPFFDWGHNFFLSKKGMIKYMDFPSGVYRNHSGGIFNSLGESEKNKKKEETKRILLEVGTDRKIISSKNLKII